MVRGEFKMLIIGKRCMTQIYINYPDYIDKIRSTFKYESDRVHGLGIIEVHMNKYNKCRNMMGFSYGKY